MIPTFNDPEEEGFLKIFLEKEKMPAFSPPKMFSTTCISNTNFNSFVTFLLSSASALNWDWSYIVSFGKGLTLYQNDKTLT